MEEPKTKDERLEELEDRAELGSDVLRERFFQEIRGNAADEMQNGMMALVELLTVNPGRLAWEEQLIEARSVAKQISLIHRLLESAPDRWIGELKHYKDGQKATNEMKHAGEA